MTGADAALAARLSSVREGIARAAEAAGRDPAGITLVVVTKFHPVDLVRRLVDLGVTDVGENRHQEAQEKAAVLAAEGVPVTWHFVGQVQGKKARQIARYADVIHSVDRERLVGELSATGRDLDCFLQVNLTDDPARGGVAPDELEPLARAAAGAEALRVRGLMAVAPLGEDPAAAFRRLGGYAQRLREIVPGATDLSAGMSHDYPQAIAAGATHLRIGTAITGNRPAPR